MHAAITLAALPARVPGQHHVHVVAARGQALRDGLHERAHRVAGKPRVRRCDHHHAMPRRHGRLKSDLRRSRHGVTAASSSTPPESFDVPSRRSTKMIGTSPTRAPRRCASKIISVEKRVPVRDDTVERQLRQRLAAPAPEPARAVVDVEARDGTDVAVGERAEDDPPQRPVDDADAVQVSRADDDVVVAAGLDEGRQVLRVVRPVRVHLAHEVGTPLGKRTLKAVDVRAPEAAPAGAVHDVHPAGKLLGQPIGDRTCPVRRPVVDDHHRAVRERQHGADEFGQVVALVVGRDDGENVHDIWMRF